MPSDRLRLPARVARALILPAKALAILTLVTGCGGGSGTPAPNPPPPGQAPTNLSYLVNPCLYRVGETIASNTASVGGGEPTTWQITPPLPLGLRLQNADGAISGTPGVEAPTTTYTVTASNDFGQTEAMIDLTVSAQLPDAFLSLAAGFDAEVILEPGSPTPAKIAKFALAPSGDDRIFYLEVDTGNVRVIDPVTGLLPTPFVSLNVLQGGHNGLLGLVLAPDFAISGFLYVLACTPADPMAMPATTDRIRVLRYTDVASVGTNEAVMIDNLPISPAMGVNNGGELLFGNDGLLFVSIGDTQDASTSQAPASTSLAGKILRYDVSTVPATIPASNPFTGSPEWCRGLRNTFGLAVHPTQGDLLGLDNGPDSNDELNFLAPGMNFEWGGTPPAPVGYRIRLWPTVIVPTALCWHDGTTWGSEYADDLFLCAYDDQMIHRFQMSGLPGGALVDIDAEDVLAEFKLIADQNHPLDICMAADGSLYVSTFSGIYRIKKS